MQELKPCPFCGGEARLMSGAYRDGGYMENTAFVYCTECMVQTYQEHDCMPSNEVDDLAIEVWNRRTERTCRMTDTHWDNGQCTWGCVCSACDAHLEHEFGRYLNFCPNCGARVEVVSDDADR